MCVSVCVFLHYSFITSSPYKVCLSRFSLGRWQREREREREENTHTRINTHSHTHLPPGAAREGVSMGERTCHHLWGHDGPSSGFRTQWPPLLTLPQPTSTSVGKLSSILPSPGHPNFPTGTGGWGRSNPFPFLKEQEVS